MSKGGCCSCWCDMTTTEINGGFSGSGLCAGDGVFEAGAAVLVMLEE